MTTKLVRVLVVDDSAFARKVLREILQAAPGIEVVGTARDGLEGLEKVAELHPDVVCLDLMMPNLDGIGFLRALPAEGAPRVLVVTTAGAESELAVEALAAGAFDLVQKPTALATPRLYGLADDVVEKVRSSGGARPAPAVPPGPVPALQRPDAALGKGKARIVVIGTSTGGPQALTRLLSSLPADFPVPIAIALHIPAGYTEALAARLDRLCAVRVREAANGLVLRPGLAVIAPGGSHLGIASEDGACVCRVDTNDRQTAHKPSVDHLFRSAAAAFGTGTVGVVLTGMGDDGLLGARAIVGAGGQVLSESESSSIVYGMPRAVREAGLTIGEASLDTMAGAIARAL